MIMTTSRPDAHRVQLCTISGNRIGLRIDDFLTLSFSSTTIGSALIFSMLALFTGSVFETEMSLVQCAIYWPLHIFAVWSIVAWTFITLDHLGRITKRRFILVTFGVQILALLITMPLAHAVMHQTLDVAHLIGALTLSEFIRHLLMVLSFEYVLTKWIWPPMMERRILYAEEHDTKVPQTHYVGPMCTVAIYRKLTGREQVTQSTLVESEAKGPARLETPL